jgi:hypothetical protein
VKSGLSLGSIGSMAICQGEERVEGRGMAGVANVLSLNVTRAGGFGIGVLVGMFLVTPVRHSIAVINS